MLYPITLTPCAFSPQTLDSDEGARRDLYAALTQLLRTGWIQILADGRLRPVLLDRLKSVQASSLRLDLMKLLELLDKRGRLVDVPRLSEVELQQDTDWIAEAIAATHEHRSLALLVSKATAASHVCPPCTLKVGEISLSHRWLSQALSRRVQRKASTFAETLSSILRYASAVILVDPYIDPSAVRYRNTIRALLQETFRRPANRIPDLIEFHLKSRVKPAVFRTGGSWTVPQNIRHHLDTWLAPEFEGLVGPLLPKGALARLVVWGDPSERFHNRFVLTNMAGISVDRGLDESDNPADFDDWEILDEDHRRATWQTLRTGGAMPFGPVILDHQIKSV